MKARDITKKFGDFKHFNFVPDEKREAVEALFGEENSGVPLEEFERNAREFLGYKDDKILYWGIASETIATNGVLHIEERFCHNAYTFRIKDGKAYSVHRECVGAETD